MELLNQIPTTIVSGIYTILFYLFVTSTVSTKNELPIIGKINKWLSLAALLYFIGFFKHEIGYYLTIESNYCKQTGICNELYNNNVYLGTSKNVVEIVKTAAGLVESVWFEAIGEGVLFAIIGIPLFVLVDSHIGAAFLTGMVAHLIAEYTGFHQHFCKKNCNVIPLR